MSGDPQITPGAPEARTARSKNFDPTIPALVAGVLLLLIGLVYSVGVLGDGSAADLLADLSGGVAATEQSGQSGEDLDVAVAEGPGAAPTVTSATVFSWQDDDGDHPELISSLIDPDPNTIWRSRYFDVNSFEDDTAIALLVTLAEPAVVSEVTLDVIGEGGEIVVRDASDGNPRTGAVLASAPAGGETQIKLAQPTEMSAIGIVFSSLPVDDEGVNRAKVSGISVR